MTDNSLKSQIESLLQTENVINIILGGVGTGALNIPGISKVLKIDTEITRTNAIDFLKTLSEDMLAILPVRIVQIPSNINYTIAVVDGTEVIIFEPLTIVCFVPNPAEKLAKFYAEMIKNCCERPYPMHKSGRSNQYLICANCNMQWKFKNNDLN